VNNKGFTLVEILIVIAVLAAVIGIGTPTIKNVLRTNLKSSAFQIASLSKFAYDSAVIKGKIHRIVFDFDKRTFQLQISSSDELVEVVDEEDASRSDREEREKQEQEKKEVFYDFPGEIGKVQKLSSGVELDSIENLSTKKKYTEEIAYLYFFPQGATEDTIIRLSGQKSRTGFYSIRLNPLNGKAKIEGRYLEVEE
jgi:general secretion pathway protein H